MRRLVAAALVITAALLAVGCDGGDDETTTVTEEETVTGAETDQGSASGEPIDCGLPPPDGAGFFDLFATNVDCATAEAVRQAWSTQCAGSDTGVEGCAVIQRFTCTFTQTGYELGEIECVREDDDAVVTFKTGA
jgi:hypothetical protein